MGAMSGAWVETEYYPLTRLFGKLEERITPVEDAALDADALLMDSLSYDKAGWDALMAKIDEAGAIVLVTPVYFGGRSSVANKLMQITGMRDMLREKVFGTVAVGAKRNGGQETTIIYSLYEALSQGALWATALPQHSTEAPPWAATAALS